MKIIKPTDGEVFLTKGEWDIINKAKKILESIVSKTEDIDYSDFFVKLDDDCNHIVNKLEELIQNDFFTFEEE